MKIVVIIPARFASTRFPGKPLALINGRAMIDHVHDLAVLAVKPFGDTAIYVATDDDRIEHYCKAQGYKVSRTSETCKTGSDRVLEAAVKLSDEPDIVINLQGDAPLAPIEALQKIIEAFVHNPETQVATAVKELSWAQLDHLRENKKKTPFSGTTVILNKKDKALWFSKTILPTIRKEAEMRETNDMSPVLQHIGLYGYRLDILRKFVNLPEGHYEKLEGLEQLRFIENDIAIQCVRLPKDVIVHSGIDSPEDVASAEKIMRAKYKKAGGLA